MKPGRIWIRRSSRAHPRCIRGLYDTGSEDGLIRASAVGRMPLARLDEPIPVGGIGNGVTYASAIAVFQVRVFRHWLRYQALVVPDDALDVDILVGEDFLARYSLRVEARNNRLRIAVPSDFKWATRRKLMVYSPHGR